MNQSIVVLSAPSTYSRARVGFTVGPQDSVAGGVGKKLGPQLLVTVACHGGSDLDRLRRLVENPHVTGGVGTVFKESSEVGVDGRREALPGIGHVIER